MANHDDEILTDNTKIKYCKQCKKCAFWGNNDDPFRNAYDKSCCDMYPYPARKPEGVIWNTEDCLFFTER